jgi:hypothetical protein
MQVQPLCSRTRNAIGRRRTATYHFEMHTSPCVSVKLDLRYSWCGVCNGGRDYVGNGWKVVMCWAIPWSV